MNAYDGACVLAEDCITYYDDYGYDGSGCVCGVNSSCGGGDYYNNDEAAAKSDDDFGRGYDRDNDDH